MHQIAQVILLIFIAVIALSVFVVRDDWPVHISESAELQKEVTRTPRVPTTSVVKPATQGNMHVLIIDHDKNEHSSHEDFQVGNDAILMVARKGTLESGQAVSLTANQHVYLMGSLQMLAQYDLNLDGVIDHKDEIFSHLLIGQYHPPSNILEYRLLSDAGIIKINLDAHHLYHTYVHGHKLRTSVAGKVTYTSGRTARLHEVPMKATFFAGVRILPSQGLVDRLERKLQASQRIGR